MDNQYSFAFLWDFWEDIFETFTAFLRFCNDDIVSYIERFLFNFFGVTIDIPIEFSVISLFSSTFEISLAIVIGLAICAFVMRAIKTLVPFF